jgi:hypothetical protein
MPSRTAPHQPSPHAPLVLVLPLAFALLAAGCATTARPGAHVGGPRDPITEAEIARIDASDAYDVVQRLRGTFLHSRGITTLERADGGALPAVFVDGIHLGSIQELRGIPARDIHEVRFLTLGDAMLRYGPGYTAGVIQVTTRR